MPRADRYEKGTVGAVGTAVANVTIPLGPTVSAAWVGQAPAPGDIVWMVEVALGSWLILGTIGGGGLSVIYDRVLTSDITSPWTIDAIPGNFINLELRATLRSSIAAVGDFCVIRINGDSGANYGDQDIDASSAVLSASTATRAFFNAGSVEGNSGTAGRYSPLVAEFHDYASTVVNKAGFARAGIIDGASSEQQINNWLWANSAPITKLELFTFNGGALNLNWKAGSRLTLYGL